MYRNTIPEEQETTFTWFPKRVDEFAEVYSANPNEIRKLKKFCEDDPEHYILEKEDSVGAFFRVHRKAFGYHKVRKSIPMTEEQKLAAKERMLAARKK